MKVLRLAYFLAVMCWIPALAVAQNTITTVAGGGQPAGIATTQDVITPAGLALDNLGNIYAGQGSESQVFKITPAGIISVYAGTTYTGFGGDGGPAINATFFQPIRLALDANQNLYVADYANNRIRRIDATTGIVTTVAGSATGCPGGTGQPCGDGGPATSASLFGPEAIAFDSAGNMFIADHYDRRIRRVDATTKVITTVAGTGAQCVTAPATCGDGGQATLATLRNPRGLAFDASGNLFIADSAFIRRVDASTKVITTVATPPDHVYFLMHEASGNFLGVGDSTVYRVNASTFAITTLAGTSGVQIDGGDGGAATSAGLALPYSVVEDAAGNIYIGEAGGNRIRKVDTSAQHLITTFAGGGSGGDGGFGKGAVLGGPNAGGFDPQLNGYIIDQLNNRIRKGEATKNALTTFAGTGDAGSTGNGGPAVNARIILNPLIGGYASDSSSNIYFSDTGLNAVRRVDGVTGVITNFAGGTTCTSSTAACGDGGAASAAALNSPSGLAVDKNNNLFIADAGDARVRRVDAVTGVITTVAGNGTFCASSTAACGDGGAATAANLSPLTNTVQYGMSIALDANGNLFIGDTGDNRVRRVDAVTGIITTVAGNGTPCATPGVGCGDGGAATSAQLTLVDGVTLDASDNLFISDNNVVRRVDFTAKTIATVVGTASGGFSGDGGPALKAQLNFPTALWVNSPNDLYIADTNNNRIREVLLTPTATFSGTFHGFGSLLVGTQSPSQSVLLTNTGAATLNISSITVVGAGFTTSNTCAGNALAPLQSCSISAAFKPTAAGTIIGSLTIVTDDPLNPTTTYNLGGAGSTVALSSIAVSPTNPTIIAGLTQQFSAIGTYSDGSTLDLTSSAVWTSSSQATATISASGLATGVAAGTSTITATSGAASGSSLLTVNAPSLTALEVTPSTAYLIAGQTQQFAALGVYNNGTTKDFSASVTWSTSSAANATISATGLGTGVALGTSTISASLAGFTGAVTSATITVVPAGFVYTGNLNTPRAYHTATLLTNGKVLIAGGYNFATGDLLNSAEIYDPATGLFTYTGNMTTPRYLHTATLLNNGKVLIAGGDIAFGGTAELYDPTTGTFTATGSLNTPRLLASATLLKNGKVLIAGGENTTGAGIVNAELYDPSTGVFTATGSLLTGRFEQSATLLNNGMVLVVGGQNTVSGILSSAELYDPTAGTFSATGSANASTYFANAVLLNSGQVLISGGFTATAGGLELYNPATGTFADTNVAATVFENAATLLSNGTVLLLGGAGAGTLFDGAFIFDPVAITAVNTGDLNGPRLLPTSTLLGNGKVLVVGGISTVGSASLGTAELYTPSSLTPTNLQSITLTPANPSIQTGKSQVFTATGTFVGGGTQTLQGVTWSSSNGAVASITNGAIVGGAAFGLSAGSSTITACAGNVCGSTTLTVTSNAPPTLVSIAVTPANPSVAKGLTEQFVATGTYSDGSTANITGSVAWASGTPAVASISNAGLATALSAGTSTISAVLGNVSGSTVLTVTAPTLVSVAVTPANPSIAAGLTQAFTATGTFTDGSTQNLTAAVTWSSATPAFATINAAGVATGVAPGSSLITAASGAVSSSTTLTVTAATLVSITVTPANSTIAAGVSTQFTATGNYSNGSTQNLSATVNWSSSSTVVANIGSTGLATGLTAGSTLITATFGTVSGSTTLNVTAPTLVSIAVTPANPTVVAGLTLQFTATGTYSNGSSANLTTQVTWASASGAVATINATGLATGISAGTSNITASLLGITSAADLLTVNATACIANPHGLVSWYTGDSTTADLLGANPPSATNAVSYAAGEVGQGFTFGNGGFLDIPASASLANQRFTWTAWVRPDGPGPNNDVYGNAILNQAVGSSNDTIYLGWRSSDQRFVFLFGNDTTEQIISGDVYPAGQFHLISASYDGSTFTLYVDGKVEGTFVESKTINYVAIGWTIGASTSNIRAVNFPRTWNGVIDEVQAYDVALTQAQIQAIYNNGSGGECKGPQPSIVVSPSPIAFGNVPVNTSSRVAVTVVNHGGSALSIVSVASSGAPFSVTNLAATPINVPANGGSTTFNAVLTPTQAGAASGTITINSTASSSPWVIAVNGTGTGSALIGTTTTLGSSVNPSGVNQSVTLTATLTPASGTLTLPNLSFTLDGSPLPACGGLPNGPGPSWICSVNSLTAGSHTIVASYAGNATFAASSASLTQVVNKAATTLGVASSLNPSVAGNLVTFTASLTYLNGGLVPTGTVAFSDGANSIAGCVAVAVSNAAAVCSTSALATGSHAIKATYSGDSNFTTSNGSLQQGVNPAGNPTPVIGLNPGSLGFASQLIGSASAPQSVTVSNSGTGALAIASIALTGTNPAEFTLNNVNCPIAPATLAAGGTCTVQASFAPLAVGARSANITFTDNTGGVPGSQQNVALSGTASAPAPVVTTVPLTYMPGLNVAQTATINCPSGTVPCTDPNAHSLKLTVSQVNQPFTLTVTAYEVSLSEANGVCEAGKDETTDFDCRFKDSFAIQTQANGDVIVPQCIPLSNGNCVYYRISNVPPQASYQGPVFETFSYNNNAFVPPAFYAANNPRLYDDPDYAPYDVNHQFVFDITDFFESSGNKVGVDPTIHGHTKQYNDFVIAFPGALPNPAYTLTFQAPLGNGTPSFAEGTPIPVAFTLAQGTNPISNATTAPNAVSIGLLNAAGTRFPALAPDGSPAAFVYNSQTQQYTLTLNTLALPPGTYTVGVNSNLFAQQTASFSITGAPLQILTAAALPAGTVGAPYSAFFTATGGTLPYSWTSTGPALPPGLTLSASGRLSGTPTTAGSYGLTVQVTDAAQHTSAQQFTLTIAPAPPSLIAIAITPANPTIGLTGTQPFTATGTYSDKSTQNITGTVGWTSSNTGIATISPNGVASAALPGSTTITAAVGAVSGSTLLKVSNAVVTEPLIGFTPGSLTFGNQLIGGTSAPQTIMVSNSGSAALAINSIVLTGTNPAEFTLTNVNCPVFPATLGPGGSCNVQVAFAPLAVGTRTANVTFTDNTGGVPGSQQNVPLSGTASAPAPITTTVQLTFPAGNNVSQVATINCPSGTTPCTDPQAHSFKLLVSQVMTPFTLTVTAYEVPLSQANGVCEAGQTETTDFDCRFATYFPLQTEPNGDVIVPQCYPYSNGNCVFYRVSNTPPQTSYAGPVFENISWNNNAYVPPAFYAANNPRLYDDPDSPPYDVNHQFVFDITDYFESGGNKVGVDPTIHGHTKQYNDFVVAFSAALPNPAYTLSFVAPLGSGSPSFAEGTNIPVAFTLTQGATPVTNAVTAPNAVSVGLANAQGTRFPALAPDGTAAAFSYNATLKQYALSLSTKGLAPGLYTLLVNSNLFVQQSTTFTVTAPTLVSIAVTPANPSIAQGSTQQFVATGTYSDGSTQPLSNVTWSSSMPSEASISSSGLATALAVGSPVISATVGSVTGSTVLTVTTNSPQISVKVLASGPQNGTFYADLQFTNTGTGTAQQLTLKALSFRTLTGTGTVTYNSALSPQIPDSLGSLAAGASLTVRVYLTVPSTVVRFSINESGTFSSTNGQTLSFASGQAVFNH